MVEVQASLAPFINQEFAVTGAWGEPRSGHIHAGIDLASVGTGSVPQPIYSMSGGEVIRVDQTDQGTGYGAMCIVWNHDNNDLWLYGDLSDNMVVAVLGQTIQQGQMIGYEGNPSGTASTGLHVHLEKENQPDGVFKFGYVNSINPVSGTGIQNVVYTTSGETYIYDGTPVPPTLSKQNKFPWVLYARKLRERRNGGIL